MEKGLRLSEIIEQLLDLQEMHDPLDLDPIIMMSSDYGDHTHVEQLNHIEDIVICIPKKSPYSDSGLSFDEESAEDIGISEENVIVLRYKQ